MASNSTRGLIVILAMAVVSGCALLEPRIKTVTKIEKQTVYETQYVVADRINIDIKRPDFEAIVKQLNEEQDANARVQLFVRLIATQQKYIKELEELKEICTGDIETTNKTK